MADMLVMCSQEFDEDGFYFSINTIDGPKRLFYIEDGEQETDGFTQWLPVDAFGERNGSIAITLATADKRSHGICRVPIDQVISKADFKALVSDHC